MAIVDLKKLLSKYFSMVFAVFLPVMAFTSCIYDDYTNCINDGDDDDEMHWACNIGDMVESEFELAVTTGERISVFSLFNGNMSGPKLYTVSGYESGMITITEPLEFQNMTDLHTFFSFYPSGASVSTDPSRISVFPVPAVQSPSVTVKPFAVGSPNSLYSGDEFPGFRVYGIYTRFVFSISTETEGLAVEKIELKAPEGKTLAFESGLVNTTQSMSSAFFRMVYDTTGESSAVTYDPGAGGLTLPSSAVPTDVSIVVNPFDAIGETLTLVITANGEEFTETLPGMQFLAGNSYLIPISFEMEPV